MQLANLRNSGYSLTQSAFEATHYPNPSLIVRGGRPLLIAGASLVDALREAVFSAQEALLGSGEKAIAHLRKAVVHLIGVGVTLGVGVLSPSDMPSVMERIGCLRTKSQRAISVKRIACRLVGVALLAGLIYAAYRYGTPAQRTLLPSALKIARHMRTDEELYFSYVYGPYSSGITPCTPEELKRLNTWSASHWADIGSRVRKVKEGLHQEQSKEVFKGLAAASLFFGAIIGIIVLHTLWDNRRKSSNTQKQSKKSIEDPD